MNNAAAWSHFKVRELVLGVLSNPARMIQLAPGDLDVTIRLLRRVRVLGRVAARLRALGVLEQLPPGAVDQLLGVATAAQARVRAGSWELDRLDWALADDTSVPLIAMKGCAYLLAQMPNAAGRTFVDVDLLIPEGELAHIETRLKAHGWRSSELSPYDDNYYRLWTHELPPMFHPEREVEVDLHHNILMRTASLKPDSELLLDQARPIEGSRFKVLAPIDMVLHAMIHLLYGGEMDDALRDMVDIDDLLRYFGTHEPRFWEEFWPRVEQLHLARPAFYGLRYASQLLGTPVPESVLTAAGSGAPPAAVLWLMDRLVPRALFPQHPDCPSRTTALARFLLYIRSHWVRMPPLMLVRHLSYKFYVRHVKRTPRPEQQTA